MRRPIWAERSLTFWMTLGMALTVLPLVISAFTVHVWLHGEAIAAFDDVAARQRHELAPLHRQQIALWEAAVPVEEFVASREPGHAGAYRELRVQIERRYHQLDKAFARDEGLRQTLLRSQQDWDAADRIAAELIAHPVADLDARSVEALDRFNGRIGASVDKLRAVEEEMAPVLDADHAEAIAASERSDRASVVAAVASLLLMLVGIGVIRRVMLANVSRLVDGARRFAAGEHAHRIEVQVPPELREVADEFNRMIVRVHEAEQSLVAQARQDPMTGLDNRRSFEEAMSAAFARLRRQNEGFVLLMLDVDHFKKVNDTHGHGAGDDVLRAVASTLAASVREVDRVFRIGGEEFAAILSDVGLSGAGAVAERVRAAVESTPVQTQGREVRVTISIGLCAAQQSGTADELLRAADAALYAAKSGGRNRVAA